MISPTPPSLRFRPRPYKHVAVRKDNQVHRRQLLVQEALHLRGGEELRAVVPGRRHLLAAGPGSLPKKTPGRAGGRGACFWGKTQPFSLWEMGATVFLKQTARKGNIWSLSVACDDFTLPASQEMVCIHFCILYRCSGEHKGPKKKKRE